MRLRDVSRWGKFKEWENEDAFLSEEITSGVHSVSSNGQAIDIYIQNRQSPVTFVTFHASVGRSKVAPFFSGLKFTKELGANLIALSDPGIVPNQNISLGWFFGTRALGDLRERVTPMVSHVIKQLGSERTVLWGASGGGYAALRYSAGFPEALVITINARLRFSTNIAAVQKYVELAWKPVNNEEHTRLVHHIVSRDLSNLFTGPLPITAMMFQNTGDTEYLLTQHRPFIEANSPDRNLFQRLEYTGEGHVPIPPPLHYEILHQTARMDLLPSEIARSAGFTSCIDRAG